MTHRSLSFVCLLLSAACAAPHGRHLPRAPLVPLYDIEQVEIRPDVRAAPDDAPESAPFVEPEHNVARPSGVVYRSVDETVDAPVDEPRTERVYDDSDARGERYGYGDYLQERAYYEPRNRRRPNPFPVNTAIGAGIGAAIGHQNGRRGRGALIGSGIGLLFDLQRWTR